MKVEQIMTPSPATCGRADNLAQVVERMWDADCGIVPVVDDAGRVASLPTATSALPRRPGAWRRPRSPLPIW